MEKAVLISIQPPHTDNIFIHKKKKVEWRKKPLPLTTHYCYETKNKDGCGMVLGQFDVVQNIEFDPLNHRLYSPDLIEQGCVPIEDLIEHANGDVIYANILENIEKYRFAKELSEFYVEGDCDCMNCKNCAWFDRGNDYNVEDDCRLAYKGIAEKKSFKPIKRPPQSWCYVERLKGD